MSDRKVTVIEQAECIGGGYAYAAHGDDVVLLALTEDVRWWRNSVGFHPEQARRLAADLLTQAERAESLRASEALGD